MDITWFNKKTKVVEMEITDEYVFIGARTRGDTVAKKMVNLGEHGVALIINRKQNVVGYISRNEILALAARGISPKKISAKQLMCRDFMEISGDETLEKVVPMIANRYPEVIVVVDLDGTCIGYFSKNDYRDALAGLGCYDLTHDPITPQEWLTKGIAMVSLGKRERGMNCFENFVRVQTDIEMGWFNLARKFEKEGRLKEALMCYDRYVKINPGDANGWFNRGNILNRLRKYLQAAQSYSRALKVEVNNHQILMNLGLTLTDAGKYDKAINTFNKLEKLVGQSPEIWYKKGNVHDRAGKQKDAIKCYQNAIELNPNHEEAWFNQGAVLHTQKKDRKAIKCFQKVLKLNPGNAEAREALSICEENKGLFS